MFSRFRNLFSKHKTEAGADVDPYNDGEPGELTDNATARGENVDELSAPENTKLEGLNLLKSLVINEHNMAKTEANGFPFETKMNGTQAPSLTQEVEELWKDELSNNVKVEIKQTNEFSPISENGHVEPESISTIEGKSLTNIEKISKNYSKDNLNELLENKQETFQNETKIFESPSKTLKVSESPAGKTENVHDLLRKMKTEIMTLSYNAREISPLLDVVNQTQEQVSEKTSDLTPEEINPEHRQDAILHKPSEEDREQTPKFNSDQRAEKLTEESVGETPKLNSEQAENQDFENTSEQPPKELLKSNTEQTSNEIAALISEKTPEQTINPISEQSTQPNSEQSLSASHEEESVGDTPKHNSAESKNQTFGKASEQTLEETPKFTSEQTSNQITELISEKTPEQTITPISDQSTQPNSEQSLNASHDEESVGDTPKLNSAESKNQTFEKTSEQAAEQTPKRNSEQTSNQSPELISEKNLDQFSEHTTQLNSEQSLSASHNEESAGDTAKLNFAESKNQTFEKTSEQAAEETPKSNSEQTSNQITELIYEKTPEQTIKPISEHSTQLNSEQSLSASHDEESVGVTPNLNSAESKNQTFEKTSAQTLEETPKSISEQTSNQMELISEKNIQPISEESIEPNSEQSLSASQDETDNSISSGALMPEICKTTKLISWVQENNANFTPPTPYPLATNESVTNLDTSSSIVVEDLPSEITTTPSPSVESSISGSSSSTSSSTLDSTSTRLAADPTKIVVNPIDSNGLACNAITNKLSDIAEVAESLDTVIRDIQENSQRVEVESNPSPRDKKMGTLRSTSSEDWHSRSTEDDSFVTASEGRTSSFMSCNKSSFEYSEGDDSTLAFDMPDVNSPFNMSYDESEQSFISAQQDANKTPTKLSENDDGPLEDIETPSSLADIEDLHSESVTPTPAENVEYFVDSIPVESETELEIAGIADAPPMEVLTENGPLPISVTPEVSSCSNLVNGRQMYDDASTSSANTQQSTNSQSKPNASWRRSKYYENITKQTIKGFL